MPSPGLPLVCEISLKTSEGDSLVLELWRLAVVAGGDPSVKVPQPLDIFYTPDVRILLNSAEAGTLSYPAPGSLVCIRAFCR